LILSPKEASTSAGLKRFSRYLSSFNGVYVSIDIDRLDPAVAPGIGTQEAAGLSTFALLDLLYTLEGRRVAAFDIMEVSPLYDNGSAVVSAARFRNELTSALRRGRTFIRVYLTVTSLRKRILQASHRTAVSRP
jgi:arginase family enzyme